MEVRSGIVAALVITLNTACAFHTDGLSRSVFDDPPDTVSTAMDTGAQLADTGEPDLGPDTAIDSADTSTDSREAASDDAAPDSPTDSSTVDTGDAPESTPGAVTCGTDTCNADPTKGPVRACCRKTGVDPYCSNTCPGGTFTTCDDHADCVVIGRPADVCCRLKEGASLCQPSCLDGVVLP